MEDEGSEEELSDSEKIYVGLLSVFLIPAIVSGIILSLNEWTPISFSKSIITNANLILGALVPLVITLMIVHMVIVMATNR